MLGGLEKCLGNASGRLAEAWGGLGNALECLGYLGRLGVAWGMLGGLGVY